MWPPRPAARSRLFTEDLGGHLVEVDALAIATSCGRWVAVTVLPARSSRNWILASMPPELSSHAYGDAPTHCWPDDQIGRRRP